MSRIGKLPITVPENVDINYTNSEMTIKGKFGTLQTKIPNVINVIHEKGELRVSLKENKKDIIRHGGFSPAEIAKELHENSNTQSDSSDLTVQ